MPYVIRKIGTETYYRGNILYSAYRSKKEVKEEITKRLENEGSVIWGALEEAYRYKRIDEAKLVIKEDVKCNAQVCVVEWSTTKK